jgi:hypothetical protein
MNLRKYHIVPNSIRIAALLLVIMLTLPAMAADESGYALLLQSSPAQGGKIIPGNGVYKIQIGQTVPLIAVPERGYRFLYWIGDVRQADAGTSVLMDGPKLIVAVFEREQFDELEPALLEASGSATGGLTRTPNPLTGTGGLFPTNRIIDPPSFPAQPKSDDFPVPNNPFPVPNENPVPEPMTIMLLGIGALAARRMRK